LSIRSAASSSSSNWTPSPLQSEHLTLEREVRAARRSSRPIGVAMVDIDHFKLYNDHYGHPAGMTAWLSWPP
jgi:predicted signal transduction protein with EAL and GGDEF domain